MNRKLVSRVSKSCPIIVLWFFALFAPATARAQEYHPGDIAVINAIIDNNHLQWEKADPADGSDVPDDWKGGDIIWSSGATNKRIRAINIRNQSLDGDLNVSELTELQTLWCSNNSLESLDVSGCTTLSDLDCSYNNLQSLDVSGCTDLFELNCSYNSMESLDVSGHTELWRIDCNDNSLGSLNVSGCIYLLNIYCYNNSLTFLDVSGLTRLQILNCDNNVLASLDVSGCTNLQSLSCDDNNLTLLNVSGLTKLYVLDCSNNNSLESLNASGCASLQFLNCEDNNLTSLDISGLTNLQELHCQNNSLISLNVSGCTSLQSLNCVNNKLFSLNLSGLSVVTFGGSNQQVNLTLRGEADNYTATIALNHPTGLATGLSYAEAEGVLTSNSNAIATSPFTVETGLAGKTLSGMLNLEYASPQLYNPDDIAVINAIIANNGLNWTPADPADGSYCPADWEQNMTSTPPEGVKWSGDETNKRIEGLHVQNKFLTGALNVSGLTNLLRLVCSDNSLSSLNVSGLINLQALYCSGNELTSLNLSGCTNLEYLDCFNNQLSSLNLSGTDLGYLDCSNNNLTSLNVSGFINLQRLSCNDNRLTSLNVSGLNNLQCLYCHYNQLSSLNVSGLNNLQYLHCDNNQLSWLDLTGLDNLGEYNGSDQQASSTLTGYGNKYTAAIPLNQPTGLVPGLSYTDGVLASNSKAITTSLFTVETGLSGKTLSGTMSLSYIEVIPSCIESIVKKRWNNNTLTVINNPQLNGGYTFVWYKWFRNNETEPFHFEQSYSAGDDGRAIPAGEYYVEVETTDGMILQSCPIPIGQNNAPEVKVYPNPVNAGSAFYLEADVDESSVIEVYNMQGIRVAQLKPQGWLTQVNTNLPAGLYILVLKGSDGFRKELKIVVH